MRFLQSLAKQTHHDTAMVDGHTDRLPCTPKKEGAWGDHAVSAQLTGDAHCVMFQLARPQIISKPVAVPGTVSWTVLLPAHTGPAHVPPLIGTSANDSTRK